jgi:protein involved in polysaccharide export with SLBB domain
MSSGIRSRTSTAFAIGLTLLVTMGQAPKPGTTKKPVAPERLPTAPLLSEPLPAEEAIKPLPLEAIPDNPPPHEGAMIELTHRIQPPDLVLVEVLQALPGRPITGEHLVMPNGKVSLGFYGEVHVAGLTAPQAKVKITHYLRRFLIDQALGLVEVRETDNAALPPLAPPGTVVGVVDPAELIEPETPTEPKGRNLFNPPAEDVNIPDPTNPFRQPKPVKPTEKPHANDDPTDKRPKVVAPDQTPARDLPPSPPMLAPTPYKIVTIAPENTNRVFVDVAAYNSAVYYVLGDFANPGRLPFTGNETILDAIQYAGGLISSAEPKKLVLNRPERGGKPGHSYKIDLDAIHRGDKKANLQIFPGDRLIVGRKDETLKPDTAPKK